MDERQVELVSGFVKEWFRVHPARRYYTLIAWETVTRIDRRINIAQQVQKAAEIAARIYQ